VAGAGDGGETDDWVEIGGGAAQRVTRGRRNGAGWRRAVSAVVEGGVRDDDV
jgi:hypothetical protein